jgi:hypothetical protein
MVVSAAEATIASPPKPNFRIISSSFTAQENNRCVAAKPPCSAMA